jgi:hypothetical protein
MLRGYIPAKSTSGQLRANALSVATWASSLRCRRLAQDHAQADFHARLDELSPLVHRDEGSLAVFKFFGEIILSLYDLRITTLVFEDELKETVENLLKTQQNKPRYVGMILSLTSKEPAR